MFERLCTGQEDEFGMIEEALVTQRETHQNKEKLIFERPRWV